MFWQGWERKSYGSTTRYGRLVDRTLFMYLIQYLMVL
jgi:hypothetical protein